MPVDAHASLVVLAAQLHAAQTLIGSIEKRIIAQHRSDEASKRLRSIPGIGLLGATAIAATIPDPEGFPVGSRLWRPGSGLCRGKISTGGKQKLGPISKQGDRYLTAHSGGRSPCGVEARAPAAGEVSLAYTQLLGRNRSRSWRWRLPTRWRASPGHCWPRAAPIGRRALVAAAKGSGDEKMRLRMCVHELQG